MFFDDRTGQNSLLATDLKFPPLLFFFCPRKRFAGVDFGILLKGMKLANEFMLELRPVSMRNGTPLTAMERGTLKFSTELN